MGLDKYMKHTKNNDFFKNSRNSYWAGFIAADGCLQTDNGYRLSFVLSNKDKILLDNFKNQSCYTGNIITKNRFKTQTNKSYEQSSLVINNCQNWFEDLENTYNIFNSTQYSSKTFSLKPPVLLDELDSYRYIVGFIDGDGCIRIDNKNDLVLAISSSDTEENPNISLNSQDPSTMIWKKIYIDLKEIISYSTSAEYFKIYLRALLDNGDTEGDIYIDNINVVHF